MTKSTDPPVFFVFAFFFFFKKKHFSTGIYFLTQKNDTYKHLLRCCISFIFCFAINSYLYVYQILSPDGQVSASN